MFAMPLGLVSTFTSAPLLLATRLSSVYVAVGRYPTGDLLSLSHLTAFLF